MNADRSASSSFGEPSTQNHPPTPQDTPTSAVFPSPVFKTPKPQHGSLPEANTWTPRFAEDYSVFNTTPGNLRGSDGPFTDFTPITPAESTAGHKRLLSAESFTADFSTPSLHFSPQFAQRVSPVQPHRQLASTATADVQVRKGNTSAEAQQTPAESAARGSKKVRRGTNSEGSQNQAGSCAQSASKGGRKLAPRPSMQNDQGFAQSDFLGTQQQQNEMAALLGNSGDLFSYPMSAPVTGPASFWDPAAAMSMDMDFGIPAANMFDTSGLSQQHFSGAPFDWGNGMPLTQDSDALLPAPVPNQQIDQPARRERPLAPKPQVTNEGTSMSSVNESFPAVSQAGGVDPILLGRPQTATLDGGFLGAPDFMPGIDAESNVPSIVDFRRTSSVRAARNGKMPDRAFASSPIKPMSRPGLSRSMSENRGKKPRARGTLPLLAPATRPASQSSGSGGEGARTMPRGTGRTSPLKRQHRLSGLAAIPEALSQPRSRASVRFTIDSNGRARAETTVAADDDDELAGALRRSRTSIDLSRPREWSSSEDDESTDDEPIIIPSRNTSFNASFALPDPRKPVGSIFHSSRRSISDKSTSTDKTLDGSGFNEVESDAETVMNDGQNPRGDATSELRKLIENRQKRSSVSGSARSHRFSTGGLGSFNGQTISPTSLTESSYAAEGPGVRCVCNRGQSDGFMVQCESCEGWLHGRCINITKRSMPRVYICAFCANTPNMRGGRMRDTGRAGGLGLGLTVSPLASKSMRSFR